MQAYSLKIDNLTNTPPTQIDLSVIVPIFNSGQYLNDCLNSLVRQSLHSEQVEFILVDDGSTDNSNSIAQQYLNDKRFRLFSKINGGASSARNYGILLSRGNYISFVDSDDIVHEECFEILLSSAKLNCADIVAGKKEGFIKNPNFQKLNKTLIQIDKFQLIKNGFSACARVFSKHLFMDSNSRYTYLFPENIWSEDNGFIPSLICRSNRIFLIPSVIYGYRSRQDGTSSSQRAIDDAPSAMNYLSQLCECRDLLIYSVFRTMNDAILRVPYNENSRYDSIKQYLDRPDAIRLLSQTRTLIKINDARFFTGRQKIYFIAFFLICHGITRAGLSIYIANTYKTKISRLYNSIIIKLANLLINKY